MDNRVAVVGGRNDGEEYFGAGEEMNFVDLDFAMLGPVVRDVSASFDTYWNSPSAYPMEPLDPEGVNEEALGRLRKRLAVQSAEVEDQDHTAVTEHGGAAQPRHRTELRPQALHGDPPPADQAVHVHGQRLPAAAHQHHRHGYPICMNR